jgi:FkbM family methyltransferase
MYRTVRRLGGKGYFLAGWLLAWMVKRLPSRMVLIIKSNTEINRKLDYQRHDIFLNIESDIERAVRLNSCKKEPETIEWIETFFGEGEVFYDVGANVGAYSLVASRFCRRNLRVYAFEPGFTTFPQLCKNIILNDCQGSITPLQVALSDRTRLNVFNYQSLTSGGALHALGHPTDYKGDKFEPVLKQPVIAYRIDDLVKQLCLPVPNHIKIDVDGIEFSVLKGAAETLRNQSVRTVMVEIQEGDEEANRIVEYLRGCGLHLRSKHRYVYGGDSGPYSRVYNYLFYRGPSGALTPGPRYPA